MEYPEIAYANTTIIKKCYEESLSPGDQAKPQPLVTFDGNKISNIFNYLEYFFCHRLQILNLKLVTKLCFQSQ